jgi:hypothetical protein
MTPEERATAVAQEWAQRLTAQSPQEALAELTSLIARQIAKAEADEVDACIHVINHFAQPWIYHRRGMVGALLEHQQTLRSRPQPPLSRRRESNRPRPAWRTDSVAAEVDP